MQITITINTDNAAFEPTPEDEVIRILTEYSERVSEYGVRMSHGNLRDTNGNTCGRVEVTP